LLAFFFHFDTEITYCRWKYQFVQDLFNRFNLNKLGLSIFSASSKQSETPNNSQKKCFLKRIEFAIDNTSRDIVLKQKYQINCQLYNYKPQEKTEEIIKILLFKIVQLKIPILQKAIPESKRQFKTHIID